MSRKIEVIKFKAQVWQVKTLVGGGLNVTLSLSEGDIRQAQNLMECKLRGAILDVAAVPVFVAQKDKDAKKTEDGKNGKVRRKQRYPYHS